MQPKQPKRHTIGRLAREAGVPVSTVRYYERAGLLRPDGRTDGNYRAYTDASLARCASSSPPRRPASA